MQAQATGFLILTLPVSLYFAVGESSIRQGTWGKRRMGLMVTDKNGNQIRFWKAFGRSLLKFVPWELAHTLVWEIYFSSGIDPAFINYGFALVYVLIGLNIASLVMTKTHQTLYDLLAGTYVVNHNVMKFHYTNLVTCHEATGMVVVIDVLRAFSNAAFAFSRGAKEIHPVRSVEEALQFKAQVPNSLACGEVGGLPPEGFDFGGRPCRRCCVPCGRAGLVRQDRDV